MWLNLLLSLIESLLKVNFSRFTDWRLSYIFPELSNAADLPSKGPTGGLICFLFPDSTDNLIVFTYH